MDVTPNHFVLDTNTVLYLLGGRLARPLPDGRYSLSVISELELLAYPDLSATEEAHVSRFLQDITIVNITNLVKAHAIDLRKQWRLKLPDALIAATALACNPTLLTHDQRLLSLTAIPTQKLALA